MLKLVHLIDMEASVSMCWASPRHLTHGNIRNKMPCRNYSVSVVIRPFETELNHPSITSGGTNGQMALIIKKLDIWDEPMCSH